ncbi:MAG: choline-sulfatase, partial [Parasphingopyxis sp.]
AAEASYAPVVALRDEQYKYVRCTLDPELLFDLINDPHELVNLAQSSEHAEVLQRMRKLADSRWDLQRFDDDVRRSQARRWVVYEALRNGAYYPWDYQPLQKASDRYMRNHMDLNEVEDKQRYPRGE